MRACAPYVRTFRFVTANAVAVALWMTPADTTPRDARVHCGRSLIELTCLRRDTRQCLASNIVFRRNGELRRTISGTRFVEQVLDAPITARSITCYQVGHRFVVEVLYNAMPLSGQEATVRYFSPSGNLVRNKSHLREINDITRRRFVATATID